MCINYLFVDFLYKSTLKYPKHSLQIKMDINNQK